MTMPIEADDLAMSQPVYTLNLTVPQRVVLEFMVHHGALTTPHKEVAESIAAECEHSVSTVYEALNRLTALNLLLRNDAGYRVNPRFYFTQNPEIAQLAAEALTAPDVAPDSRAEQPRRTSPVDTRRRRNVRPVS